MRKSCVFVSLSAALQQGAVVYMAVIEKYNLLPAAAKPTSTEYTVLAGIVAINDSLEFHVLSIGTGTKCIGREACDNDTCKHLLRDSHAEVIARRGLQRYLLSEIDNFNYNVPHENLLLDLSSDGRSLFSLKPEWQLYLYVSENPCGDASIYLTSSSKYTFTGAKLIVSGEVHREPKEQILGAMRIKSCRSDVPDKNRTASMSCSDKIAKWISHGLTSTILRPLLPPIYLSGIVVSQDAATTAEYQLQGLVRAFETRVPNILHRVKLSITELMHSDTRQRNNTVSSESTAPGALTDASVAEANSKKRCSETAEVETKRRKIEVDTSSSLCCNWVCDKQSSAKRKCANGVYELTVGHIGCLHGTTKKNIGNMRSRSRLSSSALLALFQQCVAKLPSNIDKVRAWQDSLSSVWKCTRDELVALEHSALKNRIKQVSGEECWKHDSVFSNWLGNNSRHNVQDTISASSSLT